MMSVTALLLVAALDPTPQALSAADMATVRRSVYTGEMRVEFGPNGPGPAFTPRLFAPPDLLAAYRRNPAAVLDLLTRIVDGGRPRDSMLALGYAVSLHSSPVVAASLVETFDADVYDQIDKGWKTTPREHWLIVAQNEMKTARDKTAAKPSH